VKDKGVFVFRRVRRWRRECVGARRESFPGQSVRRNGRVPSIGSAEKIIPDTVDALRAFNLKMMAAGHCTSWRAVGALTSAFGDAVIPLL
jgi:hypothetical protein